MSIASSRPPASFRARSLALALMILLALFAGSPRMFATNSMRPIATEPASFGGPHSAHIAATDRDPSVPSASSVSFPSGDAGEPAVETF